MVINALEVKALRLNWSGARYRHEGGTLMLVWI